MPDEPRIATPETVAAFKAEHRRRKRQQEEERRIWGQWHNSATTTPVTWASTANDVDVWPQWIATTSATTSNDYLWDHWNREWNRQVRAAYVARERPAPPPLTPEQQEARRIEGERRAAELRASQAILEAAKEKAEKLLQSALTPQQKEELKTKGHFHCKSNKGVIYRIRRGTHGNVRKLDPTGTKEVESLCIQPDNVPAQDAMLAQKLMIENDEDTFRKIANITRMLN